MKTDLRGEFKAWFSEPGFFLISFVAAHFHDEILFYAYGLRPRPFRIPGKDIGR
jgi:hypothetical protein